MRSEYSLILGTEKPFTGVLQTRWFGVAMNSIICGDQSVFKVRGSDGECIDVPRNTPGYDNLKVGQTITGTKAQYYWWPEGPYGKQTRFECVLDFGH